MFHRQPSQSAFRRGKPNGRAPDIADHISDDDLERLIMGRITDEAELAPLEEHLLVCAECIARGSGTLQFMKAMRAALGRKVGKKGASDGGSRSTSGHDLGRGVEKSKC
jgi:hypothetical protein